MVLGIPFVIHEQNAAMGVTNRFFASRARKVLLTYAEAYPPDPARVVVTGNPVRKEFLQPAQHAGRFAKKPGEFWILVVGGSRGALSLNNLCVELTKQWLDDHPEVILLHVSGERDYEMVSRQARSHQRYQVLPYLHEMQEGFAVADVLVSRAGATILAEIGCCGKPAVLVPFPFATDNHQEKNARVLEGRGAARVILDRELTVAALDSALHAMRAPGVLEAMAKQMMTSRPVDVEERIRNVLAECLKK
jgi:UDP-N-acetylglucosamine--N-acetylmuramyl-(pentapeptide) pyrophosphoryl-undecaprenol N-acetylglucosamine transferase